MTNLFKQTILSFFFLIYVTSVQAQLLNPKYEVGINAGAFIYQGDLTPADFGSFKTPTLNLGLSGSRFLSNTLALRLELAFGKLKGDESKYSNPDWRQQRSFAFKSSITELTGAVVYQPIGRERKLSPYLFVGIGYAFVNIKRDYSRYNAAYFSNEEGSNEGLNADIAHSLPKAIPVLPMGAGLRYRLNDRYSLGTEASYRVMSTDYLDGFSQSANPDEKDHYYKYSIGIFYSLGGKDKYACPVIKF